MLLLWTVTRTLWIWQRKRSSPTCRSSAKQCSIFPRRSREHTRRSPGDLPPAACRGVAKPHHGQVNYPDPGACQPVVRREHPRVRDGLTRSIAWFREVVRRPTRSSFSSRCERMADSDRPRSSASSRDAVGSARSGRDALHQLDGVLVEILDEGDEQCAVAERVRRRLVPARGVRG